jgi:hypothetical protein
MICVHARHNELEKMGASALSHLVIAQMGRIERLELLVAKLRREHFGPKSERTTDTWHKRVCDRDSAGCTARAAPNHEGQACRCAAQEPRPSCASTARGQNPSSRTYQVPLL